MNSFKHFSGAKKGPPRRWIAIDKLVMWLKDAPENSPSFDTNVGLERGGANMVFNEKPTKVENNGG